MGLRIISGTLKGRKLATLAGRGVRPTADRFREALFNILSSRVQGAVVLDLYAGTGALGIEAISRGAASGVFIDNSRPALSVVQRNIVTCRLEEKARTIRWNPRENLICIRRHHPAFDLVFMDPPYNSGAVLPTLAHLHRSRSLGVNACVVVEHSVSEPMPPDLSPFVLTDRRKYGGTLFTFLAHHTLSEQSSKEISNEPH